MGTWSIKWTHPRACGEAVTEHQLCPWPGLLLHLDWSTASDTADHSLLLETLNFPSGHLLCWMLLSDSFVGSASSSQHPADASFLLPVLMPLVTSFSLCQMNRGLTTCFVEQVNSFHRVSWLLLQT